jgi:hypothetical protein
MGGLMGGMNSQMPALRSQLTGITNTIHSTVASAGLSSGGGGGAINLHFHGVTTDQATVRQMVQALKDYKRKGGNSPLGIA